MRKGAKMNQEKFNLICSLARIKKTSKAFRAVELVQMHQARQIDAARIVGISPSAISRLNARFVNTWRMVERAK